VWWRVYYSDSVFTDADGEPFDAPRVDVQVIVQEKDGDYEIVHGKDYFYWEPVCGGWHGTDIFGAFDHLIRSKRQCLLMGRMLSDPDWKELFARVKAECGARSAAYAREYQREPRF
jgi:hypothetical protein